MSIVTFLCKQLRSRLRLSFAKTPQVSKGHKWNLRSGLSENPSSLFYYTHFLVLASISNCFKTDGTSWMWSSHSTVGNQCKESFICLGIWGDFREEEVEGIADGPWNLKSLIRDSIASKKTEKYVFVLYFTLWIIAITSWTPAMCSHIIFQVDIVFLFILQVRKLRLRRIKWLAQVNKW